MTNRYRPSKFHRRVVELCRATGKPWRIDRGKRHLKVYVADRMVGVFSYTRSAFNPDTDRANPLIATLMGMMPE